MNFSNTTFEAGLFVNFTDNSIGHSVTISITVDLTPAELWIQLIVFYGLLCGVVSTVLGVLICVGIWRKKELRSRFFNIVACLTVCRILICLQILCAAVFRALRTLGLVQLNQKRITCHSLHFWLIAGLTLELTLLCTLVIDRMIAIQKINYYRLMSNRSALYLCLAQYLIVGAIKFIPSYVGYDMLEVIPCVNVYSFANHKARNYAQIMDIAIVFLILILYSFLMAFVRRKAKKLQEAAIENDVAKIALQRQIKLVSVLRNLVYIHCGFTLVSKALLLASVRVPAEYEQRIGAAGGVAACLDLFVNVAWLLISHKELREAALPCLRATNEVGLAS